MKTFFVLLLAVVAITLVVSDEVYSTTDLAAWNKFKTDHGRAFDEAEEARRLRIFMDNKKRIDEHNVKYANGEVSYSMAINHFADRLPEEISRGLRRI